MLARVTTFNGGTPESVRAAADEMRSRIPGGPPPGVKSSGLTMLVDPDGGRVMMIGLFANEEDLRESEAALQAMDVPEGMGARSDVEVWELGAEVRM